MDLRHSNRHNHRGSSMGHHLSDSPGRIMAVGSLKHCRFIDFDNNVWHFERWSDSQGVHYRVTDDKGVVVAEAVNMKMRFNRWVHELIGDAIGQSNRDG